MYKIQSGKNDILIIPSQKKILQIPLRRENFCKIDPTIRLNEGEGERTNKQTLRGSEATKVPSFQEWTSTNDDDDNGGEEKPPPSRRSFPTDKSVGRTVADSVLQFVSIRPRKNPRKKARAVGGKRKQNARRRRRDIYIHGSLSCSTFDRRKRKEERRAKHELFPASVVQKPRGILVFPTIHNALSIINRVRNRKEERERKGDGESILFLEKNTPPRRPFL